MRFEGATGADAGPEFDSTEGVLPELLMVEALDEADREPKENDDRSLKPDDLEDETEREIEGVEEMDALRECERLCLWPGIAAPCGPMEKEGGATLPSLNESNLSLTAKSSFAASAAAVVVEGRSTANMVL